MVMKRESATEEPSRAFLTMPAGQKSYDEIVDLFARGASSAEVLAFRPSPETQERVRELLERNAAAELTEAEAAELERFGELEHLMQLVKARAQEYLKTKT
jgi:methylase of polypeptide subunit release factors